MLPLAPGPMFLSILKLFAGSLHRRFLRKCAPLVKRINALEIEYQKLSDDELRAKTAEFKARHAKGESLDALLPEAFAVVKNAGRLRGPGERGPRGRRR